MKRANLVRAAFAMLMAVVFTGPARAGFIIDQQYGSPPSPESSSVPFNAPLGQSFTPTLTGINFATFQFTNFASVAGTYEAEVHSGINGSLLGTSAPVSLPASFGGSSSQTGAQVEFDFANTIALTPGSIYSLILVRLDSTSNFAAIGIDPGTYGGGSEIVGGSAIPGLDLIFSEGINVSSAAPEPASVTLLGLGSLGLLGYGWRRRKQAVA
jgi:hypothetical protein